MGVEVDSVIVDLEARIGQYRTNMQEAIGLLRTFREEVERPVNDNGMARAAANAKRTAQETVKAEEQATQQVGATRKARTATAKQADAEEAASAKAAAKAKADAAKLAAKEEAAAAKEGAAAVKAAEREKQAAIAASERAMAQAAAAEARFQAQQTRRAETRFYAQGPQMFEARARELRATEAAALASAAPIRRPLDITSASLPRSVGWENGQNPFQGAAIAAGRASPIQGPAAAAGAEAETAAATAAKERSLIEAEINDRKIAQLELSAQIIGADKAEAAVLQEQLFALQQFGRYRALGMDEASAQVKVEADLLRFEQQRVRAAAEQAALVEQQMRAQSGAIASKISGGSLLTGAIVGGFGVAEISHLNDRYIELSNSLKVAGVSASEFDAVQQHLLTTANKNGTNINALADVFRSASLGAHDLGASQADLLKLTDAASNAMRIQGVSAARAQGSLLQLGHAFEGGRVNAREFNSLALNLYPILQAAAKGSDQFGGSVAKLRAEIIAGNVSSKIFFDAIIAGSGDLEERAGKATLTTAQGFTSLTNALVVYFGQADQAQGVSATLGAGLKKLADNLDTIIPAITAVGTALAVGYVLSIDLATVATSRFGLAVLGAFGGPVGLAVTALTLGIGYFVVESNKARAETEALNQRVAAQAVQFASLHEQQELARLETGNLSEKQKEALTSTANLTGEADKLSEAWARVAAHTKEAAVEQAKASLFQARIDYRQAKSEYGTKYAQAYADAPRPYAERGLNQGLLPTDPAGALRSANAATVKEKSTLDQATQNLKDSRSEYDRITSEKLVKFKPDTSGTTLKPADAKALAGYQDKLAGLEKAAADASGKRLQNLNRQIADTKVKISDLQKGYGARAAASDSAGLGRGAGTSAETLAKRAEAARLKGIREAEGYNSELKQAHDRELQAQIDLSNDAEKRADLERQRVRDAAAEQAHNDRLKGPKDPRLNDGVEGTGERTAAQTQGLVDIGARTASSKIDVIDRDERLRKANEARSIADANIEIQKTALQAQEGIADTLEERRKIARQIVELEYQQKEAALQAVLAKGSKATPAERTIAQAQLDIAQAQLDALPGQKATALGDADRANQGAGRAYADSFSKDPGQIVESTEVKILQDFNGELDKTVSKALNLHGIFGEIVDDLIQMAIKQALIAPIANSLFPASGSGGVVASGGGGGLGGLVSGLLSGARGLFGGGAGSSLTSFVGSANAQLGDSMANWSISGARAAGGPVSAGKTYLVGEKGPELLRMGGQGGNIVPNNALGAMSPNTRAAAPQAPSTTINQTIRYSGAVDIADKSYVQQMGAALYAHTEQAVNQGNQQTLTATPAYMQRNSQLK